jgi:hypothetical protein
MHTLEIFTGWPMIELSCLCGKLQQRVLAEEFEFGRKKLFEK